MKYSVKIILLGMGLLLCSVWLATENPEAERHPVEIRVQVLDEGRPVMNLKKDDFALWVDAKHLSVTGCQLIRKKINSLPETDTRPRSLLFIFDLVNHVPPVRESVDLITSGILRNQDQIVIFMDHHIMMLDPPIDKNLVGEVIANIISSRSEKRKQASVSDIKKLNESINYLRENTERTSGDDQAYQTGGKIHRHYYMKYFKSYLEQYARAIRTYNRKYLLPDISEYTRLMNCIGRDTGNIWAFQFMEPTLLPELTKKNRAIIIKMRNDLCDRDWTEAWMDELDYSEKINRLLADIDTALKVTGDFETGPFIKLLNDRNVTLYSVFITGNHQTVSSEPDQIAVGSAIQGKWRQIALASGGDDASLLNFKSSFTGWIDSEKIFYILSTTANSAEMEHITVAVPGHEYRIIQDKFRESIAVSGNAQTESQGKNRIAIQDLLCKNRELSFSIIDFRKAAPEAQAAGQISVRIQLVDEKKRNLYSREKNFTSKEPAIKISIDFRSMPESTRSGVLEVTDLVSGETRIKFFPFE